MNTLPVKESQIAGAILPETYKSIGYEGNVVLDNYRAGIRW